MSGLYIFIFQHLKIESQLPSSFKQSSSKINNIILDIALITKI